MELCFRSTWTPSGLRGHGGAAGQLRSPPQRRGPRGRRRGPARHRPPPGRAAAPAGEEAGVSTAGRGRGDGRLGKRRNGAARAGEGGGGPGPVRPGPRRARAGGAGAGALDASPTRVPAVRPRCQVSVRRTWPHQAAPGCRGQVAEPRDKQIAKVTEHCLVPFRTR